MVYVEHYYVLLYVSCYSVLLFNFFFFKQKTAYEMRISDWSSDVCSSDLPDAGELADMRGQPDLVAALHCRDPLAERGIACERIEQIGRASCRERVCQYV